MPTSLLHTPANRRLWPDDPPPQPPPPPPPQGGGNGGSDSGGPGRPPSRSDRPRRRPLLAVLLVAGALLGGASGAGLLVATGTTRDGAAQQPASASDPVTGTRTGDGLDAGALYAATSAGVVAISADAAGSSVARRLPFGDSSPQQATGTGFVIDDEGHILTAAHVVDGASSIEVTFEDGETRTATLLGQDDATDVVLLKVDPSGMRLQPLKLGSSESLEVGDEVAAIGNPFGYQRSISTGIVSGVDRTIQAPNGFTIAHAIQTDAALNPGNSGGPLLNADGEVVGIVDQIATGGGDQSSGVGFAVPVDLVTSELAALESGDRIEHGYLGVGVDDPPRGERGAALGQVVEGGPADAAGMRAGDLVTRIGDTRVDSASDLVTAVSALDPGDRVEVVVERDGETLRLPVTIGAQPEQARDG